MSKKSSKRKIEDPFATSSRIDIYQNEESPGKRKNKKKIKTPLATSSPARNDNFHLNEEEQTRRNELLEFMESEYQDKKKIFVKAIMKKKMSFMQYLDLPFTLDLLSDEELAKVKLLHPEVQLPSECVVKKGQIEKDSGIASMTGTSGILKSELTMNNSDTQQSKSKLHSKVSKKVAFNMPSFPEMPEKHLLMRRPVAGERMVSINGSPLVGSDTEGSAQLSFTTADRKRMVHIPSSQNRFSQERIPELDPQALRDLSNIANFINHVLVQFEKK